MLRLNIFYNGMCIVAPVISLKFLIFKGFHSKPDVFRSVGYDNEKNFFGFFRYTEIMCLSPGYFFEINHK